MELMECNLTKILFLESGYIPEPLMAYICREVLRGLAHLHIDHRIHRDVKSDNVLVDLLGNVKLGDFGYAAQLTEEREYR